MRMTDKDERRLFYVVQFIESPFEGIDDYVCVPFSWVYEYPLKKSLTDKIFVNYPNNEDPFETRERVKRREQPNKEWKFYVANLIYVSEHFQEAEYWIAINKNGPVEEESKEKDTKPEPEQNRKLRSGNLSCWSETNSDKPLVTVKSDNNPRKPLSRMSIRRSLCQEPDQNVNNKCLKLNKKAKLGILTDHITAAPGSSKQKQSIIITDNQVIQENQRKTNYAPDVEMNTEQSTQPEVIKKNHSVDLSVQSTSAKLSVELQHSPQLPTEQQLSLPCLTRREPSPQPPINRQPSPKFKAKQHYSSKLSEEKQASPVGQDYQQPVSMSAVDLDESDEEIDICQNVLPGLVTDERPSTKTLSSAFKPVPQLDPINKRPTPLVRHKHSLPSRDVTAGQSKEPNDCRKTHTVMTAPKIAPKSPNTSNQLFQIYEHPQLPFFSVNSTLNSKFEPQGLGGINSIEVFDNHSFLHSHDISYSMPSTSFYEHTSEKLTQMLKLKARQESPAMKKVENPVDKKTGHKDITKNITTLQYPPNSMRQLGLPGDSIISQRDLPPQGIINTAAQNLSKLAHQYNLVRGTSREQQYLPTHENYLQQFTHLQDMPKRPTMTPTFDQNAIPNGGFVIQSQPNPINQPIQLLLQNGNQYVPINNAYSQEVKSHELMKRYTDGAHVIYKPIAPKEVNFQFPAHRLSSQSHQDAEHLQEKQDQHNYQDPRTTNTQNGLLLKSTRSSLIPKLQKVTKRSQSLSTSRTPSQALLDAQRSCLIQELGIQERVNQSSTISNNTNLSVISENQKVELASTTKDTEVQTMPSCTQIHATQFTLVQNKHNCQCPAMKKTLIDQATETDSMMDVSHCVAGSSLHKSASRTVKSVFQTDEWMEKEQKSFYKETASDSDSSSALETASENEVVPEADQATLAAEQNFTQENQHEQSKIIVEQEMLDVISTLLTQMGASLACTRDMFNCLRNSILVCKQTYETLLEKVDKLNSMEPLQISASPPSNVISQGTQGRSNGDNDNTTSVGNATTSIREQRGTFSLPAEYDPDDTKWTLKYREFNPGLVELIPRTGVYVKKKELKRCIRESNDCRTLARMLLTEVFSQNALSVCSWTGGKAKAFNSVNIDVRPGLDENARMVLLLFVEQHGKKRGWSPPNITAVMSTIRTKINDIRDKNERTCKV